MNGLEQESVGHATGGLPLRVVDSVLTSPPLGIGEEDSVPGLHVCVSFGLRLSAGRLVTYVGFLAIPYIHVSSQVMHCKSVPGGTDSFTD